MNKKKVSINKIKYIQAQLKMGVTKETLKKKFKLSRSTIVTYSKIDILFYENHINHRKLIKRPYNIFACLLQRCNNPKNKDYKYYGGRGIKCEWETFENFWGDMEGSYFTGGTIDRIDNAGNYCKENCRWVTQKEQPKNRRPASEWEKTSTYWLKNRNS